jgi:hypothetical protein
MGDPASGLGRLAAALPDPPPTSRLPHRTPGGLSRRRMFQGGFQLKDERRTIRKEAVD